MRQRQAKVVKTMWDSHDHTRREIATQFKVLVLTIVRSLRTSSTPVLVKGSDACFLQHDPRHGCGGEVIGGESFDPVIELCDLESIFTVRCDDGSLYQVHG